MKSKVILVVKSRATFVEEGGHISTQPRIKKGWQRSFFNLTAFGILITAALDHAPSRAEDPCSSQGVSATTKAPSFFQKVINYLNPPPEPQGPYECDMRVDSHAVRVLYADEPVYATYSKSDALDFLNKHKKDCRIPTATKFCSLGKQTEHPDGPVTTVIYDNRINIDTYYPIATRFEIAKWMQNLFFCNQKLPDDVGNCSVKVSYQDYHLESSYPSIILSYNGHQILSSPTPVDRALGSEANNAFMAISAGLKKISDICTHPSIGKCKLLEPGQADVEGKRCNSVSYSYTNSEGRMADSCNSDLFVVRSRMLRSHDCLETPRTDQDSDSHIYFRGMPSDMRLHFGEEELQYIPASYDGGSG